MKATANAYPPFMAFAPTGSLRLCSWYSKLNPVASRSLFNACGRLTIVTASQMQSVQTYFTLNGGSCGHISTVSSFPSMAKWIGSFVIVATASSSSDMARYLIAGNKVELKCAT